MSVFTGLCARGVRATNDDLRSAFQAWRGSLREDGWPEQTLTYHNFYYVDGHRIHGLGLGQRLEAQWTATWKKEVKHIHAEAAELSAEILDKPRWWIVTIRGKPSLPLGDLVDVANKLLMCKRCLDVTLAFEQKGTTEDTLGAGAHFHAVTSFPRKLGKGKIIDLFTHNTGFLARLREHIDPSGVHVEQAGNPQRFVDEYMGNHVSADGHKEVTAEWDAKWRTRNGLAQYYTHGQRVILGTSTTPRITL